MNEQNNQEKTEEKIVQIIPVTTQPTTDQQKFIRDLYTIAILVNKINCSCEVCKVVREMADILLKLI